MLTRSILQACKQMDLKLFLQTFPTQSVFFLLVLRVKTLRVTFLIKVVFSISMYEFIL